MTEFTEWPSMRVLVRTIVPLIAFIFLPGYFIALARGKRREFLSLLMESPAEAIGESVVVSALLLGFAAMALMFSIGFSEIAIIVLEAALLAATWWNWKKTTQQR